MINQYLLVRAERVSTLASVLTRTQVAFINVDSAVRTFETLETVTSIRVLSRNAYAIGTARAIGTMVDLGAMRTLPTQRTSTGVV